MFVRLGVLFVTVTLTELYLLFWVTDLMGSPIATIGLVLFTGFLGAWLTKQQGLSTLHRIQKAVSEGRMPAAELVDGGMILFAGALLLTPGILTDAFGFSLLAPPCRAVYRKLLKRMFPAAKMQFHATNQGFRASYQSNRPEDPDVIDGSAAPSNDVSSPDRPQLPD